MSSGVVSKLVWPPLATYFFIEGLNVKPSLPGASRKIANKMNAAIAASLFAGLINLTIIDVFVDTASYSRAGLYVLSAAAMIPPIIVTIYIMRGRSIASYKLQYEDMSSSKRTLYVATHAFVTAMACAVFLWS